MSPPTPGPADFRIRVDGMPTSIGLPTFREAEKVADELVVKGHRVEIVDLVNGKVLKRLP